MSPQARAKLPPELGRLTRKDMEAVIYQAKDDERRGNH